MEARATMRCLLVTECKEAFLKAVTNNDASDSGT